jgi:F-type H+-transporting ATPase subunit b
MIAGTAAKSTASIFLIPNGTFIAELIAFLLLVLFIAKVVVPPLRKVMNDREAHIKGSLDAAEEARRSAEESSARRREVLETARQEARGIIDQASETAEQLKEDGRQRGQEEYDRLVESARHEIQLERDRARNEVMQDLGALVIEAAERVVGAGLDPARHRALVEEAITAAQATGGGDGDGTGSSGNGGASH